MSSRITKSRCSRLAVIDGWEEDEQTKNLTKQSGNSVKEGVRDIQGKRDSSNYANLLNLPRS